MEIITNRYRRETGLSAYKYNWFGKRIHNQAYIDWLEKQCVIHNVVVPKGTFFCGENELRSKKRCDKQCDTCFHIKNN